MPIEGLGAYEDPKRSFRDGTCWCLECPGTASMTASVWTISQPLINALSHAGSTATVDPNYKGSGRKFIDVLFNGTTTSYEYSHP